MTLRMKDKDIRVVCFPKAKWNIFQEKQEPLTPLQISNYIIGPNWQGDGEEIRVNGMTVVNSPATSKYNFQYLPNDETNIVSLEEVLENIESGQKVRIKGKIIKGKTIESVDNRGLRMLKSTVNDGTSVLYLSLWENEIDSVQDYAVYDISNVSVRLHDHIKSLTTTQRIVFTQADSGDNIEQLDNSVALEMLKDSTEETTLQVKAFRSIKVDKYRSCIQCNKKLPPGLQSKIVKCMRCFHRMRVSDCPTEFSCHIYVELDDNVIQLTIFTNVLQTLLNEVREWTEDNISEQLLELSNIELTFNTDNIVTAMRRRDTNFQSVSTFFHIIHFICLISL